MYCPGTNTIGSGGATLNCSNILAGSFGFWSCCGVGLLVLWSVLCVCCVFWFCVSFGFGLSFGFPILILVYTFLLGHICASHTTL